jgi:drug/metabolite transporter (DMT)-like permease
LTSARRSHVVAAFAAVYVVWGSTYLAIRFGVETIPPFLMAGGRFLISGWILYLWARWRGSPRPTAAQWRDATLTGTLMLCLGNGAVSWAEQRVPSGLASLIVAVVPLWMVLIDWARSGGTRPRTRVMLGVVVGLAGLFVLIGPGALTGHGTIDSTSVAVLMAGSLSWAAGSVFNRFGARPDSAVMSTGVQMLGGGVVLLLLSALFGELRAFHLATVSTASWLGLVYLVTCGSLVGFTAYIYLLQVVSPAKVSTYAYVNPIVAVLLGWAFVGEVVTRQTAMAAAVILVGVAMISIGNGRAQTE